MKTLIRVIMIYYYFLFRKILFYYGNFLVRIHFERTPQYSTEDSFGEMVQERLRIIIRKNEQRQHTIFMKMLKIGRELGVHHGDI